MKKDVSMVKMVFVILSALSLVAMASGSVMAEPKQYDCESSDSLGCLIRSETSYETIVQCQQDINNPWVCSGSEPDECTRGSQKKSIFGSSPSYLCNSLCGYCRSGWIEYQGGGSAW